MTNKVSTTAWARMRRHLFRGLYANQAVSNTPQLPAAASVVEHGAESLCAAGETADAQLVQALQSRIAEQNAELFYAKAALAAEIRERQTAELELQRAMEQERFAVAGRLAASVAHEINTPLQTVQTSLELMRSLPVEEHDVLLADALEEIERIGRIVRQLLDLYRPASEGEVDLSAVVERVLLLLGKRIQDQHVEVQRQSSTMLPAYGRADELTQVVINLVVNALDVMPSGGVLSFHIRPHEQPAHYIELVIGDTGPGVPLELRELIFDPFVTTKSEGTGLGLAISRQIVERHGGKLTLAPAASGGSTFVVMLPVYAAEVNGRT